jgi:hypothetical protein
VQLVVLATNITYREGRGVNIARLDAEKIPNKTPICMQATAAAANARNDTQTTSPSPPPAKPFV